MLKVGIPNVGQEPTGEALGFQFLPIEDGCVGGAWSETASQLFLPLPCGFPPLCPK